ncbi:MAG: RNA polymerase sigma-70 factor [Cyclobacteriaceae bacterium]|nr:RNA polymerase sigma-70 factor [Cyclobacteriaceae bacterium]
MIADKTAFQKIFLEHYARLFQTAFRLLRDRMSAEDVVQEVFAKLWINRDQLTVHTNLGGYLRKSVVNACLNYLDKQSRLTISSETTDFTSEGPTKIEHEELSTMLDNAIGKLPPQCRIIFTLSRKEGLGNQEIADQLGLSKRTVENQLAIALIKLREMLKPFLAATVLVASLL